MKNKNLKRYAFLVLLFWMALYTYPPQLAVYSGKLGADPVLTGLILGSYGLSQMVLRVPLGIASDLLRRRKPFILLGCALILISGLGLALSGTPGQLLFSRGIAGAAASAWVIFTVWFSESFDPAEAPRAMAQIMVYNQFGCLAGTLSGGLLSQWLGTRASFWMSAALGAAAVLLAAGLPEGSIDENRKPVQLKDMVSLLKDPLLLSMSLAALLIQVVQYGTTQGFTPKLGAQLGGSAALLGFLSSVAVMGSAASTTLNSRVTLKKFGAQKMILGGILWYSAATILLPMVSKNIPTLLAMQFLAGVGNGFCYPLLMGLAIRDTAPEQRGAAMGIYQSVYACGMFLGPAVTGFFQTRASLEHSISLIGCTGLAAFAVCLAQFARMKKQEKTPAGQYRK